MKDGGLFLVQSSNDHTKAVGLLQKTAFGRWRKGTRSAHGFMNALDKSRSIGGDTRILSAVL
jgi:hypothetical protein